MSYSAFTTITSSNKKHPPLLVSMVIEPRGHYLYATQTEVVEPTGAWDVPSIFQIWPNQFHRDETEARHNWQAINANLAGLAQ